MNSVDSGATHFTGSNASGKSTFIKALAVNAILAQTLGVCAARIHAALALAVSSMAVSDNPWCRRQRFVAELKILRCLLACAQTGMPCLCCAWMRSLKGTNTVERIAASAAVLRYLAGCRCLCFVATHDRELTEMLAGLYETATSPNRWGPSASPGLSVSGRVPRTHGNANALLARWVSLQTATQAAEDAGPRLRGGGRWPANGAAERIIVAPG